MTAPAIYGPDPMEIEGVQGQRYWINEFYPFTGIREVDERLSGYPIAVFQPTWRDPAETPVLIGVQGMCAPYLWSAFLAPMLLEMGIATVLVEAPFGGERSMSRNSRADAVAEVALLIKYDIPIDASLLDRMMQAMSRDLRTVISLIEERHGLRNPRRALFGVSLGTLLTSYAFMREGIGQRLLGTIGHADLLSFAKTFKPAFAPLIVSLPQKTIRRLARLIFGHTVEAGIEFIGMLDELSRPHNHCLAANPMTYSHRVDASRPVRFLVGDADPFVKVQDAIDCAAHFPNGASYVVPGLAHGVSVDGPTFMDHVRYYVSTQLGDWRPGQ
ncbi:MAG TPA: hypothetical protein VHB77_20815 [Planctomycetaceae bacterium]|nr:hypothetical protein [Planctomycetaceae bacterium]